jgi:aconitate hydratase
MGDNITTDHILPAGSKILPLRSNIPAISEYAFSRVDPEFARRAKEKGGGFVVGGSNYGQGSSREHAALAPMYLGLKAAIVKSFARIHRANLINFGILPLIFADGQDYDNIIQGDYLQIERVAEQIRAGQQVVVSNASKGTKFMARHDLTAREVEIVLAGGMLNCTIKATA